MDSQVYRLLASAENEKNVEYVKQAFKILDPEAATSFKEKSTKDVENFGQNLYVECAEKAINFNELSIASKCIQIYFSLPMIANQFLPRAYLCQFELLAPRGTHQLENLDKSIPFLFKSIEFSQQNKRYNFLVYNASVIFWKYARAFLKPNFKRFLCVSLKKLTHALRDIEDADYEWRAILEKTLIEAYIDNKQINEASSLAAELNKFIRANVPSMFDEYFEFMISQSLIDDDELKQISTSKWELTAIFKIQKLKKKYKKVESTDDGNLNLELNEIYKAILPKPQKKKIKSDENENEFLKSSFEPANKKEDFSTTFKRQKLLLSLAHLCLTYEEVNLCSNVIGYLKESDLANNEFSIEIEFIECELAVKHLKHKQERYSKNVVKLRTDCINKLHESLRNAQRSNNSNLIQLGCMMQWNLCLPLLQPGLRSHVRRSLQYVAECLEEIESMEWLLRCQIHFELAKCDEEIEQLQTAEQHLLKAIQLDDGNIYKEQLDHSLKRLRLRGELYKTPEKLEDQVAMILEQCVVGEGRNEKKLKPAISDLLAMLNSKNGKSGNPSGKTGEINTHSLLLRAADLLANEFTHVLESETYKAFGKLNEDQVTRLNNKALNYESCIKKCIDHLNDRINEFERRHRRDSKLSMSALSSADENVAIGKEFESVIRFDFKNRLKLWFDLCRIARKQQIWDICRVSARFCLLYDNERFINRFLKDGSANQYNSLFDKELMRNLAEVHFVLGESLVQYIRAEGIELFEKPKQPEMEEVEPPKRVRLSDDGNMNQSIQSGLRDFETDKEWLSYCEWIERLSKEAVDHFLRGIQIGVGLNESYLVSQGSTYVWNYLHHIFEQNKHKTVNPILIEILDALRKVGHNTEPELLVAVCVGLARGLMMPWLPEELIKSLQIPNNNPTENQADFNKKKSNIPSTGQNVYGKPFTIPNEANADIRKALEICDYAMNVTNGDNLADVVSLKDRFPLIKTWVLAKQVNLSPIKNFGMAKNSSTLERVQDKYSKCMIAVQILNRNYKIGYSGTYEIKEAPSIKETISLIDQALNWPDKLVELELWSNLAFLASKANQTENLRYIHSKALELISYFEKRKSDNKDLYLTSQFLLSETCIALGEHLAAIANTEKAPSSSLTKGQKDTQQNQKDTLSLQSPSMSMTLPTSNDARTQMRRDALNAFSDGTFYASKAENYEFAVHSARHYWNLCLNYLGQSQERATLYDNICEILQSFSRVYKFKLEQIEQPPAAETEQVKVEEVAKKESDAKQSRKGTESSVKTGSKKNDSISNVKDKKEEGKKTPLKLESQATNVVVPGGVSNVPGFETANKKDEFNPQEDAFDDLTLRCVFYACLFQIIIDRQDYEEALEQMEMALNDLPRTKHRLLIYRFKVITKSKLGMDVQMDLQKFREESEKNLAQMYRKVGLSSINYNDTINSYQRAIESLNSDESIWLKFEYILELAQWLYSHEYDINNCSDLCEWAIDLIMFRLKSDKKDRVLSSSTSTTRSKSVTKKNPPKQGINILPTIEDNAELKTVTSKIPSEKALLDKIEKDSEAEMESTMAQFANKETLFEINITNKSMTWNDLIDIRQLDCLIRAHTVLAMISGRNSYDYVNYVFKAYNTVVRMLNQAVDNAFYSIKEIQKLAAAAAATAQPDDKKKGTQSKNSLAVADPKSNQAKKLKLDQSSSSYLPQNLDQWSQFEISEEITSAWTHELMKKTGINSSTIVEPYLLFYYLDKLANMLEELGFSHLLFQIYYLQLYLISCSVKFNSDNNATTPAQLTSLHNYVRLRLINLCVRLNLIASVAFHQQALATFITKQNTPNPLVPENSNQAVNLMAAINANPSILIKLLQVDANEACFVREQIYAQKQRLSQLENEDYNLNAVSVGSFTSSRAQNVSKAKKKLTSVKISELKRKKQTEQVGDDLKFPGDQRKVDNSLSDSLYKDVWIIMAEQLIHNGFFQLARDFIYESLNASVAFDDKVTLAKIYYLLGKIALYDYNFIEARNYASSAQKIAIDEIFWYNCISLLVEAYKLDFQDKEATEKAIKVLNKALDLVEMEKVRKTNHTHKFAYIEAMLNFELAEITLDGHLNDKFSDEEALKRQHKKLKKRNSMHPSLFKKLSQICTMYQFSIEMLLSNGYKREAIKIFKSHASLLRQFANDCHNLEAKKDYLLQSYAVLNDASNIMNEIWTEINSLQSATVIQNVSLPVQRELVDIRLEIANLLTDMVEVHLNEITEINENNLNKNLIVKAVENYIVDKANVSVTEAQWRLKIAEIPDLLSTNLICCHNLSSKIKILRAPTFYLIGRTFRLIADLKFQLRKINLKEESSLFSISIPLSKWNSAVSDIMKQVIQSTDVDHKSKAKSTKSTATFHAPDSTKQAENVANETNELADALESINERGNSINNLLEDSQLANLVEIEKMKNLIIHLNQIEAVSMECLLQAESIAFLIEDKQLIRNITYELIELIGRLDIQLCSSLISLYQSASNAIDIENVVERSSLDPKNSLLSGYMHQLKFFKKTNIISNSLNSPIVKQLLDTTKASFNASKFLTITQNHFNLTKDLPSNYVILIMQHSHNKTELYGTIIDRKTGQGSQPKASKAPGATTNSSKAMVIKLKTDPFELNHLQSQWKDWKNSLQNFNSKLEFQLSNDLVKKPSISRIGQSSMNYDQINDILKYYLSPSSMKFDELTDTLNELESKFSYLVEKTENYLRKMSDFFQSYFNPCTNESVIQQSKESKSQISSTQIKPNDKVIILADLDLLELSLESLKVFRENTNICSVTRDYSLQFFATRFYQQKESVETAPKVDEKKDNRGSKMMDKKAAQSNIPINNEPLPEGAIQIDHTKFKYLIDPFNESSNGLPTELTPIGSFKKICNQYVQYSARWSGVTGADHIASLGEKERLLLESNCFAFNGTERFLSYFNSAKIASLNLNDCKLIISNSLAQTTKSSSRLGKLDVLRNESELECENPLESSILLSLSGVKCVLLNQWTCTLAENCDKFNYLFKEFIENRQSCGEIVRYRASPHLKFILSESNKKEEIKDEKKTQLTNIPEKKDEKKDKNKKETIKEKSPTRSKSPTKKHDSSAAPLEHKTENNTKEQEEKRLEIINNLAKLRKENYNLICYGLPDVYF